MLGSLLEFTSLRSTGCLSFLSLLFCLEDRCSLPPALITSYLARAVDAMTTAAGVGEA